MLSALPKRAVTARTVRKVSTARTVRVNSRSGRWSEQAEAAASVKRLIDRDRKEFLGEADMMAKYKNEFGEGEDSQAASSPAQPAAATAAAPSKPSTPVSPFGSPATPASPFKTPAAPTSPFGAPVQQTQSKLEPTGLSPYMSPDPLNAEPKVTFQSIIGGINTLQVVLVLSFSTIIGLMVATFYVVNAVGAVRLAGLD